MLTKILGLSLGIAMLLISLSPIEQKKIASAAQIYWAVGILLIWGSIYPPKN